MEHQYPAQMKNGNLLCPKCNNDAKRVLIKEVMNDLEIVIALEVNRCKECGFEFRVISEMTYLMNRVLDATALLKNGSEEWH